MSIARDLAYTPRNVLPATYVGNTDPALDADNGVLAGKRWTQTENDTDPWGDVVGEFIRNADNTAWLPANAGGAAPTGTAGGDLTGTYPNPTFNTSVVTAAAKTVLDDATTSDMRTTLGLAIGTNVQAYDAELAAIAGLTSAADKGIQFTGSGTAGTYDLTAAGKALLDDADAAAQRTTLGLGTMATVSSTAGGDLAGTFPSPTVAKIHETSGPTALTIGTITDGQYLKRVGATLVSGTPSGTGLATGTTTVPDTAGGTSDRTGQFNIEKDQTTAVSNVNEVVSPLRVAFTKSANCTGNIFDAVNFDASSGASPGTGNMHTLSLTCNFTQNTADEATPLFSLLIGTGTGRLWGADRGVRGPTAAQANMIVGDSIFVANQHSGAVSKGAIGLNITTGRSGEGHASATTYPLDYGILLNGMTGAGGGTTKAMTTGIGIGVANLGGWSVSVSRIGTGIYIENFDTAGISFGGAYTGSPAYLKRDTVFSLEYDGRLALGTSTINANAGLHIAQTARATILLNSNSVTAKGRIQQATSTGSMYMLDNAYFDGSNWQRDDTAANSSAILTSQSGNPFEVRYTALGAGAITWTTHLKVTQLGSTVTQSAALATGATDGFVYAPSCAGTPTGAPTAQTGTIPFLFDSTNNKLFARLNGAWKSVTLT